jgi:hypothetical protein
MEMKMVSVSSFVGQLMMIILLLISLSQEVASFGVVLNTPLTTTSATKQSTTTKPAQASFDVSRTTCRVAAKKQQQQQEEEEEGWIDPDDEKLSPENVQRRNLVINAAAVALIGVSGVASASLVTTTLYTPTGFTRISPIQFVAALGDPKATSGTGAHDWGVWPLDPGPRGVWLRDYDNELVAHQGRAPAGWTFDETDWWVEEHGLIMEAPTFPVAPGRYLVTGGRMVTTGLTIDQAGGWKLDEGTLLDVTHLPCRSARYKPVVVVGVTGNSSSHTDRGVVVAGSPRTANLSNFPVAPGAEMPPIPGCTKQDYAVLFIVGRAV